MDPLSAWVWIGSGLVRSDSSGVAVRRNSHCGGQADTSAPGFPSPVASPDRDSHNRVVTPMWSAAAARPQLTAGWHQGHTNNQARWAFKDAAAQRHIQSIDQ
jgi:hypothetical protein